MLHAALTYFFWGAHKLLLFSSMLLTHENFCQNCGEFATEDFSDRLSTCARCFVLLNEMFAMERLSEEHIEGVFDESELNFLLALQPAF